MPRVGWECSTPYPRQVPRVSHKTAGMVGKPGRGWTKRIQGALWFRVKPGVYECAHVGVIKKDGERNWWRFYDGSGSEPVKCMTEMRELMEWATARAIHRSELALAGVVCPRCKGTGKGSLARNLKCPRCYGDGRIEE